MASTAEFVEQRPQRARQSRWNAGRRVPNERAAQRRCNTWLQGLYVQATRVQLWTGFPQTQGIQAGGLISGPGSGSSDSILAVIEGIQPIRLSNGEAVLNRKAVELVGDDFIHRINAGDLE